MIQKSYSTDAPHRQKCVIPLTPSSCFYNFNGFYNIITKGEYQSIASDSNNSQKKMGFSSLIKEMFQKKNIKRYILKAKDLEDVML